MEGFLEAICSDAQISIVFDGFSSGKFVFVNPIHQLLWAITLACHFLDLGVKECPFGILYNSFEFLPTFQASRCSIFVNGSITLIVPLLFGVSCDSRSLSIFIPCLIDQQVEAVDRIFEAFLIADIESV